MKAIISHDIDHITVFEHAFKDLILPKYIVRMHLEVLHRKISLTEYLLRAGDFFRNKWQNIDELIAFHRSEGLPSSFFIGVQNGLGLSYGRPAATYWTARMLEQGCEVGVHGIEYATLEQISREYADFQDLSGLQSFGTRMHYVRTNEHTLSNMAQAGYLYDSTEHSFRAPYKIGNMWEFPFQVMDGWVIQKGKRRQSQNLYQACENTKRLVDECWQKQLPYIGIDFHDRYFSKSFKTWIDWYIWLIGYLKANRIEFVNFRQAMRELEASHNLLSL